MANGNHVDDNVIDVEPEVPNEQALDLRHPSVPATINDIAALKGGAMEVVQARAKVLAYLRQAAIQSTSPEDWLLFRAREEDGGQIIGYLQDCGCDRVRDLYGIEIFDVTVPEKVDDMDNHFSYLMYGSGRCKLTLQEVCMVMGARSSKDDFCRGKSGVELDIAVRKATRANLDGNITRELAGMNSVPSRELEGAWTGTGKSIAQCRHGRGFGSGAERAGANVQLGDGVTTEDLPVCPGCGKYKMRYRPAGKSKTGKAYDAFLSCPDRDGCGKSMDAKQWLAKQQAAKIQNSGSGATQPKQPTPDRGPRRDEIPF